MNDEALFGRLSTPIGAWLTNTGRRQQSLKRKEPQQPAGRDPESTLWSEPDDEAKYS